MYTPKKIPFIGIIIGILIFRPLRGGGLLIMGLHYHYFRVQGGSWLLLLPG